MLEVIRVTKTQSENKEILATFLSDGEGGGNSGSFCSPAGCPPGDVCNPSTGQPCGPECIPAACSPAAR